MKPMKTIAGAAMIVRVASAASAAVGAVAGYEFGQQIGGLGLSLLLAVNAGVFAALLAGMALEALFRRL